MFKRKYPSNPCHPCSFLSVVPSTSSAVISVLEVTCAIVVFIETLYGFRIVGKASTYF